MILVDLVLLSLTIQGVGSTLPDGPCAQTLVDTASGRCIDASSVPTLGSLYPLSEDLFIDPATGYVGMGDVPLFARLSIRESFYGGISSTTSGGTSSDTIGVLGVATNSSGSDIGVYGHTSSTTLGEGVWGVHAASTGTGPGVRGMTNSIAVGSVGDEQAGDHPDRTGEDRHRGDGDAQHGVQDHRAGRHADAGGETRRERGSGGSDDPRPRADGPQQGRGGVDVGGRVRQLGRSEGLHRGQAEPPEELDRDQPAEHRRPPCVTI
jgi:hypothetical protein